MSKLLWGVTYIYSEPEYKVLYIQMIDTNSHEMESSKYDISQIIICNFKELANYSHTKSYELVDAKRCSLSEKTFNGYILSVVIELLKDIFRKEPKLKRRDIRREFMIDIMESAAYKAFVKHIYENTIKS